MEVTLLVDSDNFTHHDVLIRLSVVLAGRESQCSHYQVIEFETHLGLFTQDGRHVAVFKLAAQLLQDDVTLTIWPPSAFCDGTEYVSLCAVTLKNFFIISLLNRY